MLRPGNAGSNTAADHIAATRLALAQLPKQARRRVLIRCDSGGGTHEFLAWLAKPGRRLQYSVGFTMTDEVCEAVSKVPARGVDSGLRRRRPGPRRRVGRRADRPARPVVLAEGDAGHRPQGTPASGRAAAVHRHRRPPVYLLRHLAPGPVSSRSWNYGTAAGPGATTGSATPRTPGCGTCPCTATTRTRSGARSSRWPVSCWPGPRCSPCTAPARRWEPKRLRLRLFAVAGRIVRGGRRLRLRLAARWPWTRDITAAIGRLHALAPG